MGRLGRNSFGGYCQTKSFPKPPIPLISWCFSLSLSCPGPISSHPNHLLLLLLFSNCYFCFVLFMLFFTFLCCSWNRLVLCFICCYIFYFWKKKIRTFYWVWKVRFYYFDQQKKRKRKKKEKKFWDLKGKRIKIWDLVLVCSVKVCLLFFLLYFVLLFVHVTSFDLKSQIWIQVTLIFGSGLIFNFSSLW